MFFKISSSHNYFKYLTGFLYNIINFKKLVSSSVKMHTINNLKFDSIPYEINYFPIIDYSHLH